jgi:hypothetical protein
MREFIFFGNLTKMKDRKECLEKTQASNFLPYIKTRIGRKKKQNEKNF